MILVSLFIIFIGRLLPGSWLDELEKLKSVSGVPFYVYGFRFLMFAGCIRSDAVVAHSLIQSKCKVMTN